MERTLPTISIIVPFKKAEYCILNCIRSILSLDYPQEDLEIIVIDDFGDENIACQIRALFPEVILLRNSTPLGADGSKQLGINYATSEIIAMTDADCVVHRQWARTIAKNLSNGCEIITGPVCHPKYLIKELIGVSDFQDFQGKRHRKIDSFPGCNFASHRLILQKIRFRRSGGMRFGSDRLSSWYMYSHGLQIHYDPDMEVYHSPAIDYNSILERRMRYGRKAFALRQIDPTLPGSGITHLGVFASPAYLGYKILKDSYRMVKMALYGRINPWHIPLLFPGLVLFRIVDAIGVTSIQLSAKPSVPAMQPEKEHEY